MTACPVSIVVVSRGRPTHLSRCLLGLSQLQYGRFEVIVVADAAGVRAAQGLPFADALKIVQFDAANISAARNIGIDVAAGDIVAFIDDDAVPEPSWISFLIAPAQDPEVAVMGGYVRGRNGISWQWRDRAVDPLGNPYALGCDGEGPHILPAPEIGAIKTEGTNMAVRREVLAELGGFDPAFHYFLDETDLNMRIARAGHKTALVPQAEVHHGFAANPLRRQDRVPRDLFDIGASWSVFLRKHVPPADHQTQWNRVQTQERHRLTAHMIAGRLEPRDVRLLLQRLHEGFAAGGGRPSGAPDRKGPGWGRG